MRRRRLLGVLAAGSVGVPGCGERAHRSDDTPARQPAHTAGSYRGGGPMLAEPHGVRIRNAGVDERYVTVAIDAIERTRSASGSIGEATEVFSTSETLTRAESVVYSGLVGSAGTYRFFVETADGVRTVYDWVVEGARSNLDVALDESGIRFTPVVTCAQACPPVSLLPRPEGAPGTESDGDDPESDTTSTAFGPDPSFRLENRSVGWRTVHLAFASSVETSVSRYRVPPDARLVLPVGRRERTLSVRVDSETATARARWPTVVPHLPAVVDEEAVTFGCGSDSSRCHLVNDDDEVHDLRVRIEPLADRTRAAERRYRLEPGETATDAELFARLGPFSLVVETDHGSRERYGWLTCPAVGPWYVVVDADGRVSVSQPPPSGSPGSPGSPGSAESDRR
ncbi:hypothetical protein [Haloprofundus salinisoli]|uniref:hypothetical protein n=1 Tax=Haloprofundus salinisoli TaxID=2876193 RepID=UPI001CCB8DE0|nr:hypothetical protein [Haloprofundus salinisoli]